MSGLMSRRSLLTRRAARAVPVGFRPPWSVPAFELSCDSCGACLTACPESVLIKDGAGRPVLDFDRGGCSFCGDCATACPPHNGRPAAIDRLDDAAGRLPLIAELGGACTEMQAPP
ncbi:MAG: 4Fe-4S dicluster domain-containing protein, partial [Magnetospirillum sp.]